MKWYSDQLLLHGERLCKIASCIFNTSRPQRCTPRYHSTHPHSPLNPLSLVSDLTLVLRCPDEQCPSAPDLVSPSLIESHSSTTHEHAPQRCAKPKGTASVTGNEATSRSSEEPLTPASGSAPKPSSWPMSRAESSDTFGHKQLQLSSMQPSDTSQLQPVDHVQNDVDLHSTSQPKIRSSGSKAGRMQTKTNDSNLGNAWQAAAEANANHAQASSTEQANSLESASPLGARSLTADDSQAQCAVHTPDRYNFGHD